MRQMGQCMLGVLLVTMVGCDMVYSKEPMGLEPVKLDPADWDGTWAFRDGTAYMKVLDSKAGLLQFCGLEQKDRIKLESYDVHIRKAGDMVFASAKDEDDPEQYVWFLISQDDGQIIVWLPERDAFRELAKAGKLPAETTSDSVTLGKLEPEHYEVIAQEADAHGELFDWKEPMALVRLQH